MNQSLEVPGVEQSRVPRCPYCRARPCPIYLNEVRFGPVPAAVFCCGKCDKIISISLVPMVPQQQSRRDVGGLILPPN